MKIYNRLLLSTFAALSWTSSYNMVRAYTILPPGFETFEDYFRAITDDEGYVDCLLDDKQFSDENPILNSPEYDIEVDERVKVCEDDLGGNLVEYPSVSLSCDLGGKKPRMIDYPETNHCWANTTACNAIGDDVDFYVASVTGIVEATAPTQKASCKAVLIDGKSVSSDTDDDSGSMASGVVAIASALASFSAFWLW